MRITLELIPNILRDCYEIKEWRHAATILAGDFPNEWKDICEVLGHFKLCKSFIDTGGGRKSKVSESIDTAFYARGWKEKTFLQQLWLMKSGWTARLTQLIVIKTKWAWKLSGIIKILFLTGI